VDDILNWVLQGGVVALAAAAALRAIEPHRARTRYAVLWVALVLVVALPGVRFGLATAIPASADVASPRAPVVVLPTGWWTTAAVPLGLWILWSCASAGQLACAAIGLRRARRACRRFPADLEATLATWMNVRTRGRRTCLMLSNDVKSAAVLGHGAPVIAVALEVLDRLAADDLDRIVVHEWAHVQRRDDLAHAVQLAVRVAAGWHPAVWWIDRQLRLEREVACDELAVSVTGSARAYAACLVRLASLPIRARESVPALAAASNLRRRIVRILVPAESSIRSRSSVAVGAGVVVCATALIVSGFRFVDIEARRRVVDLAVHTAAQTAPRPTADPASPASAIARATARPMAVARSRRETGATESPARAAGETAMLNAVSKRTGGPTSGGPEFRLKPSFDKLRTALSSVEGPDATVLEPLAATTVSSLHLLAVVEQPASSLSPPPPPSPWAAAADAGVGVGQTSQKAALATAGFFTRFGKRVARSFD
jgi:beta-lactamase regulating signal transducer with metallopeptidase domain